MIKTRGIVVVGKAAAFLIMILLMLVIATTESHAVTYPTLVGHRGVGDPHTAALGIPENSIPAIQWAAEHHADVVEGDVQISAPSSAYPGGVMYMMHDETLDRTTNGTGSSTDRTWDYIRKRWLEVPVDKDNNNDYDNTPYHPPTFRQWLAAAKATGKLVFVEMKNGPQWWSSDVNRFWKEVKNQGMTSRVIVSGSTSDVLTAKGAGASKRSINVGSYPSVTSIKSVVGSTGYATMRLTEAEANPDYVDRLQDSGLHVFLWTLDKPDHYSRALPLGAYGWMCDNTNEAWTWLEEHGA